MSPRPDVTEERQNQILDAATTVFTRLGIKKARMDDIALESGLSKGALYWYFKSKDEIILSIIQKLIGREFAEIEELLHDPRSAKELLLNLVEIIIRDIKKIEQFLPLMYEFYSMAFRSNIIQQLFKEYVTRYVVSVTTLIQQGIDNGELVPCDPKKLAIAIGAIFEGVIIIKVYDPDLVNFEEDIRFGAISLIERYENK